MMIFIAIFTVSSALILGALWGLWAPPRDRVEGFSVALAGGALLIAAILELIQPAIRVVPIALAMGALLLGAVLYSAVIWWLDHKSRLSKSAAIIATVLVTGLPENVALGVALIGDGRIQVTALIGAMFLSNLPDAAGNTKDMAKALHSRSRIVCTWMLIAVALATAALLGHYALSDQALDTLAYLRCFAAGAIICTLATDVFPKAFTNNHYLSGIATAIGIVLALSLNRLG